MILSPAFRKPRQLPLTDLEITMSYSSCVLAVAQVWALGPRVYQPYRKSPSVIYFSSSDTAGQLYFITLRCAHIWQFFARNLCELDLKKHSELLDHLFSLLHDLLHLSSILIAAYLFSSLAKFVVLYSVAHIHLPGNRPLLK